MRSSHRDEGVDHRVADEVDRARPSMPSRAQVLARLGGVDEQQSEIWSATIRLISSGIVRSKLRRPGLDVGDRNAELGGHERRCQRRVDVARHEHQVGSLVARAPARGAPSRARSARRALPEPTSSMWSGSGTPSSSRKISRHHPVVVLAGVDEHVPRLRQAALERRDDRRHLDEVRPCPDDVHDLHGGGAYPPVLSSGEVAQDLFTYCRRRRRHRRRQPVSPSHIQTLWRVGDRGPGDHRLGAAWVIQWARSGPTSSAASALPSRGSSPLVGRRLDGRRMRARAQGPPNTGSGPAGARLSGGPH